MKLKTFFLLVVGLSLVACQSSKKNTTDAPKLVLTSQIDRLSYAIGADQGRSIAGSGDRNFNQYNLKAITDGFSYAIAHDSAFSHDCEQTLRNLFGADGQKLDTKYLDKGSECLGRLSGMLFRESWKKKGGLKMFDPKIVVRGYEDALHLRDTVVSKQDQMELIQNFFEELNRKNGALMLEEAKKLPNTKVVQGVVIQTLKQGTGKSPKATDEVSAAYIVMNAQGDTIQDSQKIEMMSGQKMPPFRLDRVIPGWTIAMQEMKEGGQYMIYVPFNLAYGQQGMFNQQRNAYDIQPYESLKFFIDLRKVGK